MFAGSTFITELFGLQPFASMECLSKKALHETWQVALVFAHDLRRTALLAVDSRWRSKDPSDESEVARALWDLRRPISCAKGLMEVGSSFLGDAEGISVLLDEVVPRSSVLGHDLTSE